MSAFTTDLKEKDGIVRFAKQHFHVHGWSIRVSLSGKYELDIHRGDLRFLLSCEDSRARQFLPSDEIVSRLYRRSRELKQTTHVSTIFVITCGFSDIDQIAEAEKGIFLIPRNDLDVVTNLVRFHAELPGTLTKLEYLLLRENPAFCLAISSKFLKDNDVTKAIEWSRLALGDGSLFSPAYLRLADLLVYVGDLYGALSIARDALKLAPKNVELLGLLKTLALKLGDKKEVKYYDAEIEKVLLSHKPNDLNAILQRQRETLNAVGTALLVPQDARPTFHLKSIFNFLVGRSDS